MLSHKFHAKPTTIDNIRFDSKLESRYFQRLKLLQKTGSLLFFLRQVPLHLPGNTRFVIDFLEFYADGTVLFTDCKGVETETFKIKRRQAEELYPIEINIVKKA